MTALTRGKIELPDEDARAALRQAADGFDHGEDWEETKAIHDAQRAFLSVFEGSEQGPSPPPAPADGCDEKHEVVWTTGDDDRAMESAVLRRVLEVHPARVTTVELVREIVGEEPGFATPMPCGGPTATWAQWASSTTGTTS
jgi:hypothetical protein